MDEAETMETRTSVTPPHREFFPPPAAEAPRAGLVATLRSEVEQVLRFRPVIQNMVTMELRVRYHRSVLGFLWTLLNPILMMITLTIVFSKLLHSDSRSYAVLLFAGMLPWTMFQQTLLESAFCIIQNENLIRKIYLPKLVFPVVRLLINLVVFVLSLVAMFVLMVPLGARFSWAMLLLPVATLLFAMFSLGLGLIIATANTFYRDCSHLVTVFLQAWYFMTPILYDIKKLPADIQWRFWLNPAYPFIRMFQTIIVDGRAPDLATAGLALMIAVVALGVGYAAFKSQEDKLIFRL